MGERRLFFATVASRVALFVVSMVSVVVHPGIDGVNWVKAVDPNSPELMRLRVSPAAPLSQLRSSMMQPSEGSRENRFILPDVPLRRAFPAPPLAKELAKQFGYRAKTYRVTTSDGYVLSIVRVSPASKQTTPHRQAPHRPAVLVLHGLASASGIWLGLGPRKAYALKLVDSGFDVWLGNFRGTPPSQKHVLLDPNGRDYWRFSTHEHALDTAAFVDAVRHFTGQEKIFYTGFSLSTTTLFIYCHIDPASCRKKIRAAFLMAPVLDSSSVRPSFVRTTFEALSNPQAPLIELLDALGYVQFPPESTFGLPREIVRLLESATQRPPSNETLAFLGVGPETRQEVITRVWPDVGLRWALDVYRFLLNTWITGVFRGLDWGVEENIRRYGQRVPPVYDLKRTSMPVYLLFSQDDPIGTPEEAMKITRALPNLAEALEFPGLNHLDFFVSDRATIVYDRIIRLMNGLVRLKAHRPFRE